MSLSGALSNALSGLTATSRAADVAASNIANVMTEGYGVREIVLTSRAVGDEGGVQVLGIRRLVDQVLIADRRDAEASLASSEELMTFFSRIQYAMGLASDQGGLEDLLTKVEDSLTVATAQPANETLLQDVVNSLSSLTSHLNQLGGDIQEERERADREIGAQVELLNTTLAQVEDLNDNISKYSILGHDVSAMFDQRQALIDKVNEIIPVTELERGRNSVALMAAGGTMLLDGTASTFEFTSQAVITADLTLSGGTLSGLTMNGRTIDVERTPRDIAGGSLDSLFQIRDVEAPEFQEKLDGFARDLIERFQDSSVHADPTTPGLLTDDGALFVSTDERGLAQRISVNALVDPAQGGEVWRVRDGVDATTQGDVGDSSLLLALTDTLTTFTTPSSSSFTGGQRTAWTLASELASHIGGSLEHARSENTFANAQYSTLKERELADGVDTDAEMQKLLLIEQSYAANARVVQVVDEMLDWLMRI